MDVYYFLINAGSVLGSLLLCYLYRQESRSWKKTAAVYLISLAALLLGAYFGRLVRGLSYGRGESLWVLLTEEHGTHFIGRILFAVLFFPLAYRLVYRIPAGEWKRYLDLFCIFLAFQHVFNRLACLAYGCCMGKYYRGPFAWKYPWGRGTGAGYDFPVYPVQIFEIVCMILLLVVLFYLRSRGRQLFLVFCICFSAAIFVSEFMMEAEGEIRIMGCSVIQYAAVLLAGIACIYAAAEKWSGRSV